MLTQYNTLPWVKRNNRYRDAGVKGMKKGQHIKARNQEYIESLKGGGGQSQQQSPQQNQQQKKGLTTAQKVGIGLGAAALAGGGVLAARKFKQAKHNKMIASRLSALKTQAAQNKLAHNQMIANRLGELKAQAAKNKSLRGRLSRLGSKISGKSRALASSLRNKFAEHRLKSAIGRAALGQNIRQKASGIKNAFSLS